MVIKNLPSEDSDKTAQAGLNFRWAHMSEGTFSDVGDHFLEKTSHTFFVA